MLTYFKNCLQIFPFTPLFWTQPLSLTVAHALRSFPLQAPSFPPSAGPLFWPECITAPIPSKCLMLACLQRSVQERSSRIWCHNANGMRTGKWAHYLISEFIVIQEESASSTPSGLGMASSGVLLSVMHLCPVSCCP